jgi:cation:H+ antiporter
MGAELLVRGASQLAFRMGISPLVVGLTIVAFGTSAPELVVSLGASLKGEADVAIGNVVGSNICNILLILGLSATIVALPVSAQLLRFDFSIMILVSGLVWALCLDKSLSRMEGLGLAGGIVIYTIWNVMASRSKTKCEAAALEAQAIADGETVEEVVHGGWSGVVLNSVLVGLGLALLAIGANWFIDSAIRFALELGVSQLVIGLTLVAVGDFLARSFYFRRRGHSRTARHCGRERDWQQYLQHLVCTGCFFRGLKYWHQRLGRSLGAGFSVDVCRCLVLRAHFLDWPSDQPP